MLRGRPHHSRILLREQAPSLAPTGDGPANLVVFPIKIRHHHDDGEAHESHQGQLPGEAEHEDDDPSGLDGAAQEDVDVLGDQVAHEGRV